MADPRRTSFLNERFLSTEHDPHKQASPVFVYRSLNKHEIPLLYQYTSTEKSLFAVLRQEGILPGPSAGSVEQAHAHHETEQHPHRSARNLPDQLSLVWFGLDWVGLGWVGYVMYVPANSKPTSCWCLACKRRSPPLLRGAPLPTRPRQPLPG